MPFTYTRDDAHRRVLINLEGDVDASSILAIFERHKQENVPSYGMLYDGRRTSAQPTLDELRHLLSARTSTNIGQGPVAFVVNNGELYRMMCSYAAMAAPSGLKMGVFRDMADADAWLTSHTPAP